MQDPTVEDFIFNQRVTKVAGACPLATDTATVGTDCLLAFDFSGHQQTRNPKVTARVTLGVNLLTGRLRAQVEVQYYGKRFSDMANSLVIPDYTLVNAQVRFNLNDHLSFYAYGTYLTNEIGLTEGNPRAGQFISGEAGARYDLARPELGRAFQAAVLYRF